MTLAIFEADAGGKSTETSAGRAGMYSSLTAVVLCIFSQVALAQCVDSRPNALDIRADAEFTKKNAARTGAN
jgi:hypothetical protein